MEGEVAQAREEGSRMEEEAEAVREQMAKEQCRYEMQLKEYEEKVREMEGQVEATAELGKVVRQLEGQVQKQKVEMQARCQSKVTGVAEMVKKMSLEI